MQLFCAKPKKILYFRRELVKPEKTKISYTTGNETFSYFLAKKISIFNFLH